jgi:4-amino-4-deoxy-L-arabinose transferase-like glycosyltransferase
VDSIALDSAPLLDSDVAVATTPRFRRQLGPRLEALIAAVLILVYLGVMLPSLTRFPPLNNDEGREAQLSWVTSGLQPGAERMNAYRGFDTWGTGGLQGATTVLLFWLFGLGVFQARLTSLIWGGLLLGVVYWLGRHYWGRAAGLTAAILLAIADPFLLSTHTLRPDIQIITLVLLALVLVEVGLRDRRGWPLVVAGMLVGLAFDTHMNTVGLAPMVVAPLLVRFGWKTLVRRESWLVAAGLGLAAAYYASVRIVPDPSGYLQAFRYWIGLDKALPPLRPGGGGGLFGQLGAEALRFADYFGASPQGVEEWPELLLVGGGLLLGVWLALRGGRPERTLLLGLLATSAFFVVLVSTKSRYYMLLTYPTYLLLVGRGFQLAVAQLKAPWLARGALAGLILLTALWPLKFEERTWDKYVRGARYRAGQEYYTLTAQLAALAGPGARVLAPPRFWFGLHDHPFVDIYVYERVRRQYGETPDQFIDAVQPDLVITDAKIATEKSVERELYRGLDARAPYDLIVRHKNYGDVAVYRLRHEP